MAAVKTIEDYKKDYEAAKAAGDAAGMQAANDGANAIRASMGVAPEYATADIANVAAAAAANSYTPINSYAAAAVDKAAYNQEVSKQQQYIASNPTATQGMTWDEKTANYGDIIDSTILTGYYTQDAAAAQKAAAAGLGVTPTSYHGQTGWYRIDKAERPVDDDSSGADEGLLNDYDYAIVQQLKQDFADAQATYNAAVAAGDTAAAAKAQQAMDNAHLQAERIRTTYGYSGGQDGSMYITNGILGVNSTSGSSSSGSSNGSGSSGGSSSSSSSGGYGGYSGFGGYGGYSGLGGYNSGSYSADSGSLSLPQGSDLSGMVEDYSSYLQQMYAAQKAGALAQLQAAYESNLAALDRAGTGVAEQYQAARNSTAGASELAKRNFAEYAAASGLNSGTGGQAELARNVTLQNNLNTIDTAQADTLADLELQRTNAEIQYNNAIAQAEATGDYELASALYQEKVRVQDALIELEIQQQKMDLQRYQLAYQAQRDSVSDQQYADNLAFQKLKYADSLAQSQQESAAKLAQNQNAALAEYGYAFLKQGVMPSSAMLAAMGITSADAQSYLAALTQQ